MCLAPSGRNSIDFSSRASRGDAPPGKIAPSEKLNENFEDVYQTK